MNAPRLFALAAIALSGCAHGPAPSTRPAPAPTVLEQLRQDARQVQPLLSTGLARQFASAVGVLPAVSPRVIFRNKAKGLAYTEAEAARLTDGDAQGLERVELTEEYYYTTKYGSPVSYVLPFDVLGAQGFDTFRGKKVVDYGYGYIGHLRMLAALGADAHGVDADPVLRALYSQPGDTGAIAGLEGQSGGTVTLHLGRFPEERPLVEEIGRGYDLFLSKNTLKLGYVHPRQPVDPKLTLQLKASDEEYVRAVWELLAPGGYALIYNLFPAQKPEGQGYIPWADGQTPFARELWARAGFQVIAFDQDESARSRQIAHALGWDQGEEPMDLEKDLFALYTLVRKPAPR